MLCWIYKNYRLGVFLIEGIVGTYSIFVLSPRGVSVESVLLLLILAVTPWVLAYNIATRRLTQEAMKAFNDDCDPEPLLEMADMTLRQFDRHGRSRRPIMISWRFNRAAALCGLGRYREALKELDQLQTRLSGHSGQLELLCCNSRAAAYGGLKEVEAMSGEMTRAMALAAGMKREADRKHVNVLSLRLNSCLLTALREGYGSAELAEEYESLRQENDCVGWQVNTRMGLAQCALAQGDTVAARGHLRFVLDNGNKLAVRAEAQEIMDKLNQM